MDSEEEKQKANAYAKQYREKHRELLRLKQKAYREVHRKELAIKTREYNKTHHEERQVYRVKNRERMNALRRASYKRTAINRRADSLAEDHIPLGKACETCGSVDKLERHHPDYNKPFDVVTLCRPCHRKLHSKYG